MERVMNDEETIKEKNWYLKPLFEDLKLLIWKVSMNKENIILRDFNVCASKILASKSDHELKLKAIE